MRRERKRKKVSEVTSAVTSQNFAVEIKDKYGFG